MKASLRLAAISLSALALAACASTSTPYAGSQQVEPSVIVTDGQYVAQVESIARRRGVTVRWFNPPVRRTPEAQ